MRFFLTALACLLVPGLGGCGADDEPAGGSGPLVTYSRTGGFASMPERLVIEDDGSATLEVGDAGATSSFDLGAVELDALRSELAAAQFDAVEPGPTGCADCYIYEVTYAGRRTTYDDAASPPASVATVVDHLTQIATDHQPPGTPQPPIVN